MLQKTNAPRYRWVISQVADEKDAAHQLLSIVQVGWGMWLCLYLWFEMLPPPGKWLTVHRKWSGKEVTGQLLPPFSIPSPPPPPSGASPSSTSPTFSWSSEALPQLSLSSSPSSSWSAIHGDVDGGLLNTPPTTALHRSFGSWNVRSTWTARALMPPLSTNLPVGSLRLRLPSLPLRVLLWYPSLGFHPKTAAAAMVRPRCGITTWWAPATPMCTSKTPTRKPRPARPTITPPLVPTLVPIWLRSLTYRRISLPRTTTLLCVLTPPSVRLPPRSTWVARRQKPLRPLTASTRTWTLVWPLVEVTAQRQAPPLLNPTRKDSTSPWLTTSTTMMAPGRTLLSPLPVKPVLPHIYPGFNLWIQGTELIAILSWVWQCLLQMGITLLSWTRHLCLITCTSLSSDHISLRLIVPCLLTPRSHLHAIFSEIKYLRTRLQMSWRSMHFCCSFVVFWHKVHYSISLCPSFVFPWSPLISWDCTQPAPIIGITTIHITVGQWRTNNCNYCACGVVLVQRSIYGFTQPGSYFHKCCHAYTFMVTLMHWVNTLWLIIAFLCLWSSKTICSSVAEMAGRALNCPQYYSVKHPNELPFEVLDLVDLGLLSILHKITGYSRISLILIQPNTSETSYQSTPRFTKSMRFGEFHGFSSAQDTSRMPTWLYSICEPSSSCMHNKVHMNMTGVAIVTTHTFWLKNLISAGILGPENLHAYLQVGFSHHVILLETPEITIRLNYSHCSFSFWASAIDLYPPKLLSECCKWKLFT